MSTHNLCFEQKYEKYQSFVSENFQFLEVKFSLYLNRHVFVMRFHSELVFAGLSMQCTYSGFAGLLYVYIVNDS